ncbi:MAG: hypothetical protein COA58_03005 [Bacteroidetes bacterium]|nr:MAG: hypothetical protein COA58_03005 [Bacteroidota bacterium]
MFGSSCVPKNDHTTEQTLTRISVDSIVVNKEIEPRIMYVIYGYYCGECDNECTKLYKHYLTGNSTTFWTDKSDSYFSDKGLRFETKMNRESEKIGFDVVSNIPKSMLKTDSTNNVYGCPDCADGCGLYFEFKLEELNSQPIVYRMEYDLINSPSDVKEFGELIKSTVEKLEKHR